MEDNDRNLNEFDWVKDTPWWYPTREVVRGNDKDIGRAAKSLVIGTQWTQARLAQHNVAGITDA